MPASSLWHLFLQLQQGNNAVVTATMLDKCLRMDLKVGPNEVPDRLQPHMPIILVWLIRNWPGWHVCNIKKNYSDQSKCAQLRAYLRASVRNVIHKIYEQVVEDIRKEALESTDLDHMAPYTLLIRSPPQLINTLVFAQHNDDDIVLKQHVGQKWVPINLAQLLSWPDVEVSFHSKYLSFTRCQCNSVQRYLNLTPEEWGPSVVEPVDTIEVMEELQQSNSQPRKVYTHRFLSEFIKQYVALLECGLDRKLMEEIRAVLNALLDDITEMGERDTIATNTRIVFNAAKKTSYLRNKKLMAEKSPAVGDAIHNNTSNVRVGYCEVIRPQIEVTLHHVNVEQISSQPISPRVVVHSECTFSHVLDLTGDPLVQQVATNKELWPKITYACRYCNIRFEGDGFDNRRHILQHLLQLHRMEHPVRCRLCKQQMPVPWLARMRWHHRCNINPPELVQEQ